MRSTLDLRDWNIRRGMLLTAALLSVTVAAAIILPIDALICFSILLLVAPLLPFMRRVVPFFCIVIVLLASWRGVIYRVYTVEPIRMAIGEQDTICGIVEDCPTNGSMYTVRITQSVRIPVNRRILLFCSDQVAPSRNDTVTATVEYKDLYRTQRYHRADGIWLQAYPTTFDENSVVSTPNNRDSWRTVLRPLRDRLSASLTGLINTNEGGLLAAVCFGDRSAASDAVSESFRAAGLSHLLAVSGLHVSMVAGGMMLLMGLLRVRRSIGNIISATVILLFMWIVEFTPSVTRAGIMCLTVIIGQLSRYRSDSLNSLGLALTVILLASPAAIYDVGLWLSFTAAIGILCITPRIRRVLIRPFKRWPRFCSIPIWWIINSVSISVGCTLPLMPLLLLIFGEVSLVSPLANLFAVLPAGWMTILGCLGSILSMIPIIGFVGNGVILLAGLLAKWLIVVAGCCDNIPGALLRPTDMWVIVLIAGASVLLSVAIVRLSFRHVCCLLCTLLCVFSVALPINSHLQADAVTVALTADAYGSVVVAEYDSKGIVLLNDAASMYTATRMLEHLRVSQPQLFVIAECRTQHEAYLAECKRSYPSAQIACVDKVGEPRLIDCAIKTGDTLYFWDACALDVSPNDLWMLSVGDTQLLVGLSKLMKIDESAQRSEAVMLYGSALHSNVSIDSNIVFCVTDDADSTEVNADDGLVYMHNEETVFLITNGDGVWRRLWRSKHVLE